MQKILLTIASVGAAAVIAPSASACDMEGFGFSRVNPFGQHAAWNVPADAPKPSQSENADVLAIKAQDNAATTAPTAQADRLNADNQATPSETTNFTVSKFSPADQAKRFTATKD